MNSPFANLKVVLDSEFPEGSIVMFDHENMPIFGYVHSSRKDKYLICTLNNQNEFVELTRNRLHKVPVAPLTGTSEQKFSQLKELKSDDLSKTEIESLWHKLINIKNSTVDIFEKIFHPAELTKLFLTDLNAKNYIRLRSSLINDRIYFKRDQKGFIPRKPNDVELKKLEEENRSKRYQDYHALNKFLKSKQKEKSLQIPSNLTFYIEQLKKCASQAHYPDESWYQQIEEMIHFLDTNEPEFEGRIEARAFNILYKSGILKKTQIFL